MRLAGKAGIVVGGGQTPGQNMGNGRACAVLFAREGAKVLVVDKNLASAEETVAMIREAGGEAYARQADWTQAGDCRGYVAECVERWDALDFLHNNVGVVNGDSALETVEEAIYDMIMAVNLKGCLLSCQAAVPEMRKRSAGSIVNISSIGAVISQAGSYKLSKAGMNGLTQALAMGNAAYGIRVNAVMPGLMDTPMAIEGAVFNTGAPADELRAQRAARVPLRNQMGDAWDVAYASLFLHSDEARYITGVALPVDGGATARVG